ncbi:DNA/RNA non-specific endonuclease [Plectosphaerella cucumerina]|uniref:Endonuclease n=1 Tax=Plectosphaerella cucumerina TaxID=40658 RepID=A0A8K0X0R0_9PEZI|nr:DNA/RNA non-specific endonuclease [Plectosphaerella cucumerina]
MSKSSIAVVAALGAGGGAALTAAMYSLRSSKAIDAQPAPSSDNNPTIAALNAASTVPIPASQMIPTLAPASSYALGGSGSPTPPLLGRPPVDPAGLFQYGFPGPHADLATRPSLISSYDRRTRNPHWVAEHITPASLALREGDRKNSPFLEDPSIPEKFQAKLKDYFRSGYDRGHQVPAADAKWSQAAMNDTFYLSNMCPQVGDGFNRDYWAHFEDFCRRLTQSYPSVRIVTGPLYLPKREADGKWYTRYEVIGNPPNIAVPTHFYKVIFAEDGKTAGNVAIGAFVMPNAQIPNDKPLKDFEVPLEAVERATGLEFASKLPAQRRRRLCQDANCAIVVKEYAERQKSFSNSRSPSP